MIITTIVTSKDGVPFSVTLYARSEAQARAAEIAEANFVRTQLACQLEAHDDYYRVECVTPRLPRKPELKLIRGGKL